MSFNYGAEVAVVKGINRELPATGTSLAGRVKSVIHLGNITAQYEGKDKPPANFVSVVIELATENSDGERFVVTRSFPLIDSDKSIMTSFLKAIDPKAECSGFDDVIGRPLNVTLFGGGESKREDGSIGFSFVKVKSFSPPMDIPEAAMASVYPELSKAGVGHCTFNNFNDACLDELDQVGDIIYTLLKGNDYIGSAAQACVEKRRETDEHFAVLRKKGSGKDKETKPAQDEKPPVHEQQSFTDLDPDQEFPAM